MGWVTFSGFRQSQIHTDTTAHDVLYWNFSGCCFKSSRIGFMELGFELIIFREQFHRYLELELCSFKEIV